VVVYDQPSARLQAGARELSYSPKASQIAKSLISRIENFLMNFRDDRFASLLPLEGKPVAAPRFVQGRRSRGPRSSPTGWSPSNSVR
jgi:hypothetical protein